LVERRGGISETAKGSGRSDSRPSAKHDTDREVWSVIRAFAANGRQKEDVVDWGWFQQERAFGKTLPKFSLGEFE
jgi:hypothetical protein